MHCFSQESDTDWNKHEEFFNFTRARFVRDEEHEMSQRRVKFNMNELARISAQAIGSKSCVDIKKYPDGMYSKAFLLTMDGGGQVVAKVPNPNAGLPHLTTASEVATMEFAREICGTPSPKVLAWSSKAYENSVGAEYIIMERVEGVSLSTRWASMPLDKKTVIVKTLARYQKSWMSKTFKQYGSLYYVDDVPVSPGQPTFSYQDKDGVEVQDKRFAVGPTVHRQTVDYGRAQVDFYRGPWNTTEEYCIGTGNREIACIKAIEPLPKPPLTIAGRYVPTRAKKLAALESYMKLIKFLLPTDSSITTSHIWHSDLHTENIFVNPDEPTEILGIIDWQSAALVPLYENAFLPALLDYDGPPLNGVERPEEPKDLDQLDKAERAKAFNNWMDMTLASYYRNLMYHANERMYRAIEFREMISYDLLIHARNILIDGEAIYLDRVADELQKTWDTLPGVKAHNNPPFPFKFSPEELAVIQKDYEGMSDGIRCMGEIQQGLSAFFPTEITVSHKNYELAKTTIAEYKEMVLESFARNDKERAAALDNQTWNSMVALSPATHGYSAYTLSSSTTSTTLTTKSTSSSTNPSTTTTGHIGGGAGGSSSVNATITVMMQKYLMSFVLIGNPNTLWSSDKLYWPQYGNSSTAGTQLVFNTTFYLEGDDLATEKSLNWNKIIWH
ncbi:hypothetical protein G7Y89_g8732 [Cudoniella acicularis]|uniref:Altered inheritance of mitochondria protein 9, mitochondrial n=1 Tax=Cudoniella acicularis TaxID=354080 RepID=A0A8H4RHN2_9HELO|nr:hypothetical protein G7Y89_g8732 [Cudoniella acicularis]